MTALWNISGENISISLKLPPVGTRLWSATASQLLNLFARNLSLNLSSNWATALPPGTSENKVPIADDDDLEDLTLVATNWKAKAAVQIAGSISLNWRTPVQRDLTATSARFRVNQFFGLVCKSVAARHGPPTTAIYGLDQRSAFDSST